MRLLLVLAFLVLSGCTARRPMPAEVVTTIYLVRHAERAPGSGDVPISEAGQRRALALRDSLRTAGVRAILVSQFQRTAQTAQPLAEAVRVPVSVKPLNLFGITAAADSLARTLVTGFEGQTVVVVGHSNTIPVMLAALTGRPHPAFDDGDFDGLYRVRVVRGGAVTSQRLRYGADDGVADPAP